MIAIDDRLNKASKDGAECVKQMCFREGETNCNFVIKYFHFVVNWRVSSCE